ncbi:DUF3102 domain-containing protein [Methylobacterium sp. WSM2598]|uniref:DUF3102 domain-containing protein n=1 Tax=Methylobacterium sp. WSM2598 TaxID=398261 RepID=UPI00056A1E7C|nr:DUF3102 domain-containing protein [Methylobacterium sp. WSM2598]
MPKIMKIGFNYAGLESSVAKEARDTAHRLRERGNAFIIEVGLTLLHMKGLLGHGAFGPWVRTELRWTDRTAQNYMRAAEVFADKSEIISHLPSTTVYDLAAKSVPNDVRNEIIREFQESGCTDKDVAAKKIRDFKLSTKKTVAPNKREKHQAGETQCCVLHPTEGGRQKTPGAAAEAAALIVEALGDGTDHLFRLMEKASWNDIKAELMVLISKPKQPEPQASSRVSKPKQPEPQASSRVSKPKQPEPQAPSRVH